MRLHHATLVLALLMPAPATNASDPGAATSGPLAPRMAGKRILHIAAHPDDEGVFAPLMAEACRFGGATCHLVVAAEAGTMGCLPSIGLADAEKCAAMRRLETAASAANLNATHEFYGWRDLFYRWNDSGLDRNIEQWARDAGGHDRLLSRIRDSLESFRPDFVLAFDPRHGTTCNPNHRAIALLTIEVLETMPADRRPEVWFASDFAVPTTAPPGIAEITDGYGVAPWPGDTAPVTWHDANAPLPDGRSGWDYLVDTMRLNATQFPEVATGKLTPAPEPEHRRIPFVRLEDVDPRSRGMCEQYTPNFPYADTEAETPS